MSDLPGPIVLNATVQYNLSLTDDLDLLDVFAEDVVTVSTVVEELEYGVKKYGRNYLDRAIGAVEVIDDGNKTSLSTADLLELTRLDGGEEHALICADDFGGTLATDDMAARRCAVKLGVEVTGSLRVLKLAIEQDRLAVNEADEKLQRWIDEGGYRSPVGSITELL